MVYSHTMEIALIIMLALVGITSCAIVMIAMWGPETLALRKWYRRDTE